MSKTARTTGKADSASGEPDAGSQPVLQSGVSGPTITRRIHFAVGRRGARHVKHGPPPTKADLPKAIPREARLMAFAIVFEEWLAKGDVKDYAELASITGLDRSRITRIMNLRLLEPREQEGRLGCHG